MEPTAAPRVKICCISSISEARLAIACGAAALGLVSEMPSGPGVISEAQIRKIAAAVPPPIATFLLTSRQDAAGIIAQQRRCGASTIQMVDQLTSGSYADIRAELPGIRLVQVLHIVDESAVDAALAVAPLVDALLLDSGNPTLKVKELGGTGRRHNWEISARIRQMVDKPIFLAGGLRPQNVGEAITSVAPFGLDLCSGVRTDGKLDAARLTAFMSAVAAAASAGTPG